MANVLWSIFWFIIMIFFSFWIAFFAAGFYIFFQIFAVCCSGCSNINDVLLQCVQFPAFCARAALDGKPAC